ncbi:MAG: ribulose-phosphate 3-epimerase [Limnochordaceae bacterium]|nr:ribulose-phosphate 3-epimerase [Limnochordaceae bacterium]
MPDSHRPIQIAPSLLAADFAHLAEEIQQVEQAGADRFHLDVMDGQFVPNLSIGIPVVEAVRRVTKMPLEVHLMIVEPERYVEAFRQAGADWLLVHAEAGPHLHRLLQTIHQSGAKAGVVLNPATPLEQLDYVLERVDQVLLMTVNPGFGGQAFLPEVLPKIRRLSQELQRRGVSVDIEVDGGIDRRTAPQVVSAGANVLVAGSSIFGQPDPGQALQELRALARGAALGHPFRVD